MEWHPTYLTRKSPEIIRKCSSGQYHRVNELIEGMSLAHQTQLVGQYNGRLGVGNHYQANKIEEDNDSM